MSEVKTNACCAADRGHSLRRSFLLILLLITMVPLCAMAGLSFFQYRSLIQEETYNNARWTAENARQTIEAFLEKLQAAILVVSDAYSVEDLQNQKILDQIFTRLKAEHKGVMDLSLIGPDGLQMSYAGIYDLAGKDYADSPWYNHTLSKKSYISEVFLGYRNVPHFVIAVSKKAEGNKGYWVVRASIDANTLDRFLALVNTEVIDDIFLINSEGKLQSSSRYYGSGNHVIPLQIPPKKNGITLMRVQRDNQMVIRATGFVRGTSWILVQDQERYFHKQYWTTFKDQLFLIFSICLVIVGAAAFMIADVMAKKIQQSDEEREIILKETEHTNKLASIGRLAAGVAHEINNPLAIINEKAGLMKDLLQHADDCPFRDKFITQLDSLENAVARSRVITHRLLGFARRMEVTFESIQIIDVIRDVLGFLDKEAAYRNIKIETFFQDDVPPVQSDRGQLQQIFLNIINNAIDAVSDGGEISISCQRFGKATVQVDISDNGPGMTAEIKDNIFEPFFTTKTGKGKSGTGLGLSITYGLMRKLGGKIAVHSKVGIGTTFSLTFPADKTHEMADDNEQIEIINY